jgi:hypothetical protein
MLFDWSDKAITHQTYFRTVKHGIIVTNSNLQSVRHAFDPLYIYYTLISSNKCHQVKENHATFFCISPVFTVP